MIEKIKKILALALTASVILINYLAAKGFINNITPGEISAKYPSFITPANYAFSIWGLIYIGLICFSVYQLFPQTTERLSKIRFLYIVTCITNVSWIFSWHNELISLSLVTMLILLSTLVAINLSRTGEDSIADFWLVKTLFSVYFGWISVAAILNATILLISFGISVSDFLSTLISCILIGLITIVGIIVRHKIRAFAYSLTIAWALTAIAVKQSEKTAIVFTCAFGVVALLISSMSFFLKDDNSKFK